METPWVTWPESAAELEALQQRLAAAAETVSPWVPTAGRQPVIGAVFCAHRRGGPGPGVAGEPIWLGAVLTHGRAVVERATLHSVTGAGYTPGLLALRVGPALEAAVRALRLAPDVLLVDATGNDHPRGGGLAIHLGARLGTPTVGVTDRPLIARGPAPGEASGSVAELRLGGAVVGYQLRSAIGARPIAVHAGWRTSPEVALEVTRLALLRHRTPEPLREARRIARALRHEETRAAPG
ncbi:MAG: endonuclease V [Candidatus Dormiibacterota bacterium]